MSTRRKLKFEMELISGGGHSEHLLYFFVVPPGFWAAGNSLTQALHPTGCSHAVWLNMVASPGVGQAIWAAIWSVHLSISLAKLVTDPPSCGRGDFHS